MIPVSLALDGRSRSRGGAHETPCTRRDRYVLVRRLGSVSSPSPVLRGRVARRSMRALPLATTCPESARGFSSMEAIRPVLQGSAERLVVLNVESDPSPAGIENQCIETGGCEVLRLVDLDQCSRRRMEEV